MLCGMKSSSSGSSSGVDFGDAVCAGDGSWKPSCLTSGGYAIGLEEKEKRKIKKMKEKKDIKCEVGRPQAPTK